MDDKIEEYRHHGELVSVVGRLKGLHKEHCLCYRCKWFKPKDIENNCYIAQENYEMDVKYFIVTPVWECPVFEEQEEARA